MIGRIAGRLEQVSDGVALVETGAGLWYELLVPARDVERLARRVGQEVTLHTIHYIEGDPSRGGASPRLIGFASETDRDFFKLFTTVKGIGVRKALRAMVRPVAELASAIQSKDPKLLLALPEIGRRTAETIIAQLHGKVDEFAGPLPPTPERALSEAAEGALTVLVQLGERRGDALRCIERVLTAAPDLASPEEIIQQVYRMKAAGR